MLTLIALIVASVVWVVLWGLGVKGFDAFMLFVLILVGAVTVQMLGKFLPGRDGAAARETER